MQSLMTADHHGRLELVENQAMLLVDSNVQHEYDYYLSRLRRMHDWMNLFTPKLLLATSLHKTAKRCDQ